MDLKRKLTRLGNAGPGSKAGVQEGPVADAKGDRAQRIAELQTQIQSLMARPSVPRERRAGKAQGLADLPFSASEHASGVFHCGRHAYPVTQRHGMVHLHTAMDAAGQAVATLALDPALSGFDPARALFVDTETTGLAGGTGTIPFLVGLAWFEGRDFHVEQFFLAELGAERPMLERVAERIAGAGALVSFNGKSFDLPLLRSRFVMSRVQAPKEPPHLDLVHVARRVYGGRMESCRLTALERDVLGFVREGDVPSSDIPERYARYLRTGDTSQLQAVIEHNRWDIVAMAALLGELAARTSGADAAGRWEPADMVGLARTAQRAGEGGLAASLADGATRRARVEPEVAARAHTLAAALHRKQGDHTASETRLLAALEHSPGDPTIHLLLAKLYEHKLGDVEKALHHAQRAAGYEDAETNEKRLARLAKAREKGA